MKTLVIIPAYNEEHSIAQVVESVRGDWDYLVVNDCSKDRTGEILKANGYHHVDLPVNLGIHGCVQTGYKYAYYHGYDAAIQIDADGQHPAEYIRPMVEKLSGENAFDIVVGSRFLTKKKPWNLRMIGSRMISLAIRLRTGRWLTDPTSGMRAIGKTLIYDYAFEINRHPEPDTLAYHMRRGAKVGEVQVEMRERSGGESAYASLWPSTKYMLKMLISILLFS